MASNVPPEEQGACRSACIRIMFVVGIIAVACICAIAVHASKKPDYSVAIATVSGLDPATDLGKPALDQVEFTLTLRVTPKSRSFSSGERFEPGTGVAVAYLGVPLAKGSTGQACAAAWKPGQMVQTTVVARGTGARLPGSVLDSLAADVRRGVAAFDVTMQIPSTGGDGAKVVSCRGRRVGDDMALSKPCDVLKST